MKHFFFIYSHRLIRFNHGYVNYEHIYWKNVWFVSSAINLILPIDVSSCIMVIDFFFWINIQIFIFDFSIEAKQYADSVDAFFIETSAKNCNNITELFINGLNRYREMEQSSSSAGQKDSPNHGQKSTRSISLKDGTRNSGKCC